MKVTCFGNQVTRKLRMLGMSGVLFGAAWSGWGQVAPQPGLDTPAAQGAGQNAGTRGEKPLDTPSAQESRDASAVSSPVPAAARGVAIRVGTDVPVQVTAAVSSGAQINGDTVHGKLIAAVRTTGRSLPAGTPVTGTVVSSSKAGAIASGGVLSLQLTSVGGVHVITNVRSFNGAEGHKDVADSAPARGSEAMVAAGTVLHFRVMEEGKATGMMPGVAPARGAGQNAGTPGSGAQGSGQKSVGKPNTSPGVNQVPVSGATQGVVPQGSTPR